MKILNLLKKIDLNESASAKIQFNRTSLSCIKTMAVVLGLFFAMCGPIFAVEGITNGSFSSGTSGWTLSGDFWAGTNLGSYKTSPGYAAGGVDNTGSPKHNADGTMTQQVTIPSGATNITLSYWYSITTQDNGGSYNDLLIIWINDYTMIDSRANTDNTSGSYLQRTINLSSSYAGQTISLQFAGTTNSTLTTVFRIDDVSLTYTVPTCTAVSMAAQPQSQTVTAGNTATFNVSVNGTSSFSFFWYKNGVQISGANSASYTTPTLSTSDSGNSYYCIITNCSSANQVVSGTAYLTVNSVNNYPSIPTLSGPTSRTTGQSGTYSTSATDPNNDQVRYAWDWDGDTNPDEYSPLGNSGWTDSRSHTWASAGTYNVKVIALDSHDAQSWDWSSALPVTITAAPPVPTFSISAPANGYAYPSGTTSTTLYWNSATGATSYDLQVGGSCGATNIYSGNANSVSRTVSGLVDGQTYYWRMQANNAAGASGYSSCRSFSVQSIPPTMASITPTTGLNSGSSNITNLAGTNFVSGATVKITKSGQSDIAATSVVFVNSTKLTCTLPISAAAAGLWNVVVTNPDTQTVTYSNGFTVVPVPVVTSISPTAMPANGASQTLVFTGSNFQSGNITQFNWGVGAGSGVWTTGVAPTINNSGQITTTINPGTVTDTIYARVCLSASATTTSDCSSGAQAVTVTQAPTITAITPGVGLNSASVGITNLAGTGFISGATVKLTKSGQSLIAATGVAFVNSTKLTCTLPISGAATGAWNVVVTNPDAQTGTLTNGFAVTAAPLTPATASGPVSTITWRNATYFTSTTDPDGDQVKYGWDWGDGSAIEWSGLLASGSTDSRPHSWSVAGTYNVKVKAQDSNGAESAWTTALSVAVATAPPVITSITPSSGFNYTGVNVTDLAGTGFLSGATVKLTKSGQADINAISVTIVSGSQLTCVFPISGAAAGTWNVVVTNTDTKTGTLTNGFTAAVDATSPAGVPTTPSAGLLYNTSGDVTFTWAQGGASDPESGITGYDLQVGIDAVNDASIYNGDIGNVFFKAFTGLPEGTYYARVRAKNAYSLAGAYSPWSLSFKVDWTPPQATEIISETHPSTSTIYLSGNVTFTLSAQDASGVAGYYGIIDHSPSTVTPLTADRYIAGSSTGAALADGLWYAHFRAKDMVGNIGLPGHFLLNIGSPVDPAQNTIVEAADGTTVEMPAGTISSAANVLITVPATVPPQPRDTGLRETHIYREIHLSNLTLALQNSITVTIPYTTSQLGGADENSLKIAHYSNASFTWEILYASVVDTVGKTVSAAVTHLSMFKLVAYAAQSEEVSSASNYPNPFTAGRGGTTKIHYSLKANSAIEIRIYDLLGKLVWHKNFQSGVAGGSLGINEIPWDGRNDDGGFVGAGGYLCFIKSGGETRTVKIAVK